MASKIKQSFASYLFDVVNVVFSIVLAASCIYPFWDTLIVSFSSLKGYLGTSVHIWPSEWSFAGYAYMFGNKDLWLSYANSLFITVVGTFVNVIITVMTAYVLSKKNLKGHRLLTFLAVFTIMFSGGIIPTYIIVKEVHLINSLWALILPTAITTSYMIIMRNFFFGIPKELEESAVIDGCTEVGVLFKIMLPVSLPGVLTIALFYSVDHWNDFFNAIMYLNDRFKWPLQLFLRSMLFESDAAYSSGGESLFLLGQPMKMSAVIAAILPIMLVFPFFQKYFTKGMLLGAVKG